VWSSCAVSGTVFLVKLVLIICIILLRDHKRPPQYKWDLRPFGILRSVEQYFLTDFSAQAIGPTFKGHAVMSCVHKRSSYNSASSAVVIVCDFTNHIEGIRKVKWKLSNNIKQCEIYENYSVHLPTNCVRNVAVKSTVEHVWKVMAHAQKPDLVFPRNGRVHINWRGRQFSRLLAAEVCASAVVMAVMLDTPCSEVECKTTGYPLHSHFSPSLPLPCVTVWHQVSTEL
jgi:hypothetical protein